MAKDELSSVNYQEEFGQVDERRRTFVKGALASEDKCRLKAQGERAAAYSFGTCELPTKSRLWTLSGPG
jgi:hypothetical protein